MALGDKQLQILQFRFSDHSYLICDGAVRSGKTSLMMVGFVDDAMTRFNGRRFGICGKTVDSATKNISPRLVSPCSVREQFTAYVFFPFYDCVYFIMFIHIMS